MGSLATEWVSAVREDETSMPIIVGSDNTDKNWVFKEVKMIYMIHLSNNIAYHNV